MNVKFLIILFLIVTGITSYAKPKKEIQIGLSFTTIKVIVIDGIQPTITKKYDKFQLRPVVRFNLNSKIRNNFSVTTFIGYHIMGGKSKSDSSQFKEIISRHAFELGIIPSYTFLKNTKIGIGGKLNFIPISIYRSYGTLNQPDTIARKWSSENVTNRYRKFSSNIGFHLKHQVSLFSLSFEAWFGFTTWGSMNTISYNAKSIENNYRLLLGYSIGKKKNKK